MKDPKYEDLEYLHGIIDKKNYEYVRGINKTTTKVLGKEWVANVKFNKRFWRKHQPLTAAKGIGRNKCVIGIGSGPSFKKNQDVLREIVNKDGVNDWPNRNFITIAANHHFKPLLEMGVIPDFVLLVDASEVVLDQLTKDIPREAENVTLIVGVHCSPKVISRWTKQKRKILFYTTPMPELQETFRTHINRDPEKHKMEMGGNVLNGAWMVGISRFFSNVFFGVGNDLSFEVKDSVDDQRASYYTDGDYSTNIKGTGSGRDEAKSEKRWAGFTLSKRTVWFPGESTRGLNRYNIELNVVGTSHTLWVYKVWLESTILGQTRNVTTFHYFNCTEGGILGVMAKADNDRALLDQKNWYMLDEVSRNIHSGATMYHTAMLKDAADVYLAAKESLLCQQNESPGILTDARTAGVLEGVGLNTTAKLASH